VLYADFALLSLVVLALIWSVIAATPKDFLDPPRHVLICVAHSDDCVILGAEYAYGAVQQGLSIRIAYLTCSGPNTQAKISQMRRAEALAAWLSMGVPKENLIFVDLAQSRINGPAGYSDKEIALAKESFTMVIRSLPEGAAVIVPAQGESHIDHRTVRSIALQAIEDCKRKDVIVYEAPEYNAFLSLVQCPERTVRAILRKAPLLNRVINPYAGSPNYVNGRSGFVFRDTPERLAKKKELLRYFTSQDGDLLVRLFGYKTPYRRVAPKAPHLEPAQQWCIPAFENCCAPSALALGLLLIVIAFLTAHEFARWLTIAVSPAFPIVNGLLTIAILLAGFYFVRSLRQTASLETSLFAWVAALGLIFGAL
jgi:LmbE family N-acetylglucosaminyl deacetylase